MSETLLCRSLRSLIGPRNPSFRLRPSQNRRSPVIVIDQKPPTVILTSRLMSDSPPLAGNVSPSSFSVSNLKANRSPGISDNLYPHTPTSPPLMSVGAQNYASNFAHTHTSPSHTTTSNGQPLSSPPSSTPMSTQNSQQPTVSITTSFPTPASSVSGHPRHTTPADESELADKSWGQGAQNSHATGHTDSGNADKSGHRRTDHDRHRLPEGFDMEGRPSATDVDMMDIDSKADNSTLRDSSLDALQQDIGKAFHLCKTGKAFSS